MAKHKDNTQDGAGSALDILKADHDKVLALFGEFDALRGSEDEDERKADIVGEICYELTVHGMIEEEIFYPMLRAATDDDSLMDEADVEHAGARDLISQLEVMYPGDDHYDATVTVLGEQVAHHIEKEEDILFQAARDAELDLDDIGEQLLARKEELDEDLGSPASDINGMEAHESTRMTPRAPN
jgi:hemerythrin superfamily protein